MVEAAIQAGCRFFAGYPITPQNEVPEYMSVRMPQAGGTFIQAESEVAAINMVYGAAAAGTRSMTSSSSPGISLKLEGISYIAGAEVPCVIANVQRGGPGLGNIRASQGDYFQAVKGGGHGDYKLIVLAPSTLQELYDLTMNAFDYGDYYRNPVMILNDGILAQMVEPVEVKEHKPILKLPEKDYVLNGCKARKPRILKTLHLRPSEALSVHNQHLKKKYDRIANELQLVEQVQVEDAELIIVAYGITGRVAKSSVEMARENGLKVGMIKPMSLWPFPEKAFKALKDSVKKILVIEMSNGQMIEDVKLVTECKIPVEFLGSGGGWYPSTENIYEKIEQVYGK